MSADNRPDLRQSLGGECILCGKCLEVCPLFLATAREELSPRAKSMLVAGLDGAGVADGLGEIPAAKLAGLCLSCGRCARVCPQKLDVMSALSGVKSRHPGGKEWLWKTWINNAGLLWPFMRHVAGVMPGGSGSGVLAEIARRARGLSGRESPPPLWRAGAGPEGGPAGAPAAGKPGACLAGREILLFPGCASRYLRPERVATAGGLLRLAGAVPLPMPDFACCGFTLGQAGMLADRGRARRENVRLWREAGRPTLAVFCATCLEGLRAYATDPELFGPDEAEVWLEAVTPLAALAAQAGLDFAPLTPEGEGGRVFWHRPCHVQPDDPAERMAAQALGARLAGRSASCCGLGGVLQVAAPGLSASVAGACWATMPVRPDDAVLTACAGCAMQLSATAPDGTRVGHWLDVLVPDR